MSDARTATPPSPASVTDEKLKALSDAAPAGPWFVAPACRTDGLAKIEDGRLHGMFPVVGEWPEIEFIVALVNEHRVGNLLTAQEWAARSPSPSSGKRGAVEGWLPIETAPRDGKPILIGWWSDDAAPVWRQRCGWWDAEFTLVWDDEKDDTIFTGSWTDGTVADWSMEETQELFPTRWQPLPAAPPPEAGSEGGR